MESSHCSTIQESRNKAKVEDDPCTAEQASHSSNSSGMAKISASTWLFKRQEVEKEEAVRQSESKSTTNKLILSVREALVSVECMLSSRRSKIGNSFGELDASREGACCG